MQSKFFTEKQQTIIFSILAFYVLALPLILLDYNNGRAFSDQAKFHLPTILHFVDKFDFSDYPSATTPGYHLILALFGKVLYVNEVFLKLISSVFTAVFIGVLSSLLFKNFGKIGTLLLIIPMIFSIYIFPAGVWLLPDNIAWLTVALILILSANMPLNKTQYLYLSLLLIFAMLFRQPNLWLASTIWSTGLAYFLFEKQTLSSKMTTIFVSILSTVPTFVIFYMFYLEWGGLVPPSFQLAHEHFSFSVPAFFFSAFAVYSLFYLPIMVNIYLSLDNKHKYMWVLFGAIFGFIVSIIPDTSYNVDLGRSSGLWNFVKIAPTVNDKSLLIILLSTLGGSIYSGMLLFVKKNLRLVIILSTMAFLLALIPNAFVYERYFSGFIFILIFLILGKSNKVQLSIYPKWVWILPILFAIVNIALLTRGILR